MVVMDRAFSSGERQLLALARALMPSSSPHKGEKKAPVGRILLCDEATANARLRQLQLVCKGVIVHVWCVNRSIWDQTSGYTISC